MKVVKKAWVCFGITLFSSAWAGVPPSQFILKTWANKHAGVKSIRIKSIVTAVEGDKLSETHFKETLVYFPEIQTFRSWASDDQDKKLFVLEKKVKDSSVLNLMLLTSNSAELMRVLKDRGIPIQMEEELLKLKTEEERRKSEVTSLDRWNGGIAWVIGKASKGSSSDPQLWFAKDLFLPWRLALSSQEFRFEDYRFFRDFPYPVWTHIYEKGERVISSQLVDGAVNADSPTSKSHPSPGKDLTEAGESAPSSVRTLIRQYYELAR